MTERLNWTELNWITIKAFLQEVVFKRKLPRWHDRAAGLHEGIIGTCLRHEIWDTDIREYKTYMKGQARSKHRTISSQGDIDGSEEDYVWRESQCTHKEFINIPFYLAFLLFTFMYWRGKWQPTPVFLPGGTQVQGSLGGCRLWGCRVGHDWSDLAAAAAGRALDLLWSDMLFLRDLKLPDIWNTESVSFLRCYFPNTENSGFSTAYVWGCCFLHSAFLQN